MGSFGGAQWSLPWERRAAKSRQVSPEEAQEPSWGTAEGVTLTMLGCVELLLLASAGSAPGPTRAAALSAEASTCLRVGGTVTRSAPTQLQSRRIAATSERMLQCRLSASAPNRSELISPTGVSPRNAHAAQDDAMAKTARLQHK